MSDSPILHVVGYSQTGKTTFIAKLIERLTEKKVRVLTLKSARKHEYNFSNKDSDILSQKGSSVSVVDFKNITQVIIKEEKDILETIRILADSFKIDIIIIEGFKEEKFTKVIIWSNEIAEDIDKFNFEGIKYLLSSTKDLHTYKETINKINNRHNFYIAEESDDLVDKIIQDYKF
jgi:molybdopterin-guanine dinucleotide biosynthesis protein B